jgi:hypothetical protein
MHLLGDAAKHRMKYWEIIVRNLKKRGWSSGYVSAVDSEGRTIRIADAHRADGKRFVVHADQKADYWLDKQARFFQNSTPVNGSRIRRRTFPR